MFEGLEFKLILFIIIISFCVGAGYFIYMKYLSLQNSLPNNEIDIDNKLHNIASHVSHLKQENDNNKKYISMLNNKLETTIKRTNSPDNNPDIDDGPDPDDPDESDPESDPESDEDITLEYPI